MALAALMPAGPLEQRAEKALAELTGDQRDLVVVAQPGESLRADYLRWLLLQALPATGASLARFDLRRATVAGELNLRAAEVRVLLRFVRCRFPDGINLTDAKLIGADFIACDVEQIAADRLTAAGSLRLLPPRFSEIGQLEEYRPQRHEPTRVKQIRLCGAQIHGNLDLRGSQLGGALKGAAVAKPLFADGITVDGNVLLSKKLRAEGELCLNGSTIRRNLDCSGATLVNPHTYTLSAAGADIRGALLLCRQHWQDKDDDEDDLTSRFQSTGVVRLDGAKIAGDLDCRNGKFTATAFATAGWHPGMDTGEDTTEPTYVLKADGVDVGADVIFDCDPSEGDGGYDISGTVSLIRSHIGGDFTMSDIRLNFPGEDVLVADGITVDGATFFYGTFCNGMLRFVQATLKQSVYFSDVTFDVTRPSQHWADDKSDTDEELGGPSCGVYAGFAEVTGTFLWQKIKKKVQPGEAPKLTLWLHLFGASGSTVQDDEQSWRVLDRFDVTNAQYSSIADLRGADSGWRLRELDRQYALMNRHRLTDLVVAARTLQKWTCGAAEPNAEAPAQVPDFRDAASRAGFFAGRDASNTVQRAARERTLAEAVKRFKPQPYLQLARIYSAAGYRSATRDILVRLERNETRYSDVSLIVMLWRWLLDLTIQYGHALLRPIFILLLWVVVSATIFQTAYDVKEIVPFKEPMAAAPGQKKPPPVPEFNALIFAIDTLLPIVDLNQKKNWMVNPLSRDGVHEPAGPMDAVQALGWVWRQIPDWGSPALLIFNTFFGWLMTTLFVAGVSGLIRTNRN